MTKTQQYLIDKAREHGGSYSVDCGGGRGSKGGRIRYGSRQRDALFALEQQGIVTITHRDKGSECNRGYTLWYSSFAYRLNEGEQQ